PLIVASALFMENLDSSILATALPAIARSLQENPLHLSLAISSYLLSLAIFIPVSGWVADRYGARQVFRAAIVVFTLGSILCGLSQTIMQLVGARALQGIGGAMMVPVGRLVVLRRIPKQDMVAAMAWITIPALVAPIVAPLIGGAIATWFSWRWIFLVNVPIGVLGFWLVTRYITDGDTEALRPMDFRGWMILSVGLVSLVFALEALGKGLVPGPLLLALLGLGLIALALYVLHTRSEGQPVLNLALLRLPTFFGSIVGGGLFRIAAGASTFLVPLQLQVGFGMTPIASGGITFAGAVGAVMMRTRVALLVRRVGFRRLLIADAVAGSVLMGLCAALSATTPRLLMMGLFLLIGFSRSLMFTCVNTMGYADIDTPDMSNATSFAGTAQQLALTIGVAAAAQILHLAAYAGGHELPRPADFSLAFLAFAALSITSAFVYMRLPPNAGSNVSGYRVTTP
ncbi:MAG: MFS transporter, partial [Pseudomonadota bacterium]